MDHRLAFVSDNSCKCCKRQRGELFANTMLDLYANIHIIMQMDNDTFLVCQRVRRIAKCKLCPPVAFFKLKKGAISFQRPWNLMRFPFFRFAAFVVLKLLAVRY